MLISLSILAGGTILSLDLTRMQESSTADDTFLRKTLLLRLDKTQPPQEIVKKLVPAIADEENRTVSAKTTLDFTEPTQQVKRIDISQFEIQDFTNFLFVHDPIS